MKWTTSAFINNRPIEEYSPEEVDAFFKYAWDKAFKAIGYKSIIDEAELERCREIVETRINNKKSN